MIKFPKTQRIEKVLASKEALTWNKHTVIVFEKIDGSNVGISFDNDKMILQSRGHVLRGGYKEKQFDLFKQICYEREGELKDVLKEKYILYCEWCFAKHRSFYDNLPGYLFVLDLFDKENNEFISTNKRDLILNPIISKQTPAYQKISSAPILFSGSFKKSNDLTKHVGPSKFKTPNWKDELIKLNGSIDHTDDSILMEGVYIKIESDNKVIARMKYPRPDFEKVQSDDKNWFSKPIVKNILKQ